MKKVWNITLYKTGNVYKAKVQGYDEMKGKSEGIGATPQTAYRDAVEKLRIRPWLVNPPYVGF